MNVVRNLISILTQLLVCLQDIKSLLASRQAQRVEEPEWLDVPQAMQRFNVSERTLRRWHKEERIAAISVGHKRFYSARLS